MSPREASSSIAPLVILDARKTVQRVEFGFDLDLWDQLVERATASKVPVQDIINVGLRTYLKAAQP